MTGGDPDRRIRRAPRHGAAITRTRSSLSGEMVRCPEFGTVSCAVGATTSDPEPGPHSRSRSPRAGRVGARRRVHARRSRHHRHDGQARPRRRIGVLAATLVPAVLIPSRLRPVPSLRLARERDPPEPDAFTVLLGRSSAARGDSWSEQYECCPDNSDDTGSQQSHGTPPRLVSPIADPLLSLPEDAMPTRARRAATGPFVPERAAAEHPCRRAVCACRRRGPRLRAAIPARRERIPSPGVSVAEPSDPG